MNTNVETNETAAGGTGRAFRAIFGKVGADASRRILNVLLESPFFYRDDDVDLFGILKRRRSVFQEFFEVFFGWELYVDDQVARVIKPKAFNSELRPRQRHVFRLAGRQEYVLFVLLLEFHQHQADRQNLDLEECDEVRFVLADFLEFVFQRYREELGDRAPAEEKLLNSVRSLFRTLEQYRFLAVRETTGVAAEEGLAAGFTTEGASTVLYALLPGIRCYRPESLTRFDLLGSAALREEAETNGEAERASAESVVGTSPAEEVAIGHQETDEEHDVAATKSKSASRTKKKRTKAPSKRSANGKSKKSATKTRRRKK